MELLLDGEAFTLRTLTSPDPPQLLDLCRNQGWMVTAGTFESCARTHLPALWGVFTQDGRLVSHCAGFAAGFIGAYITAPAYRGRGLGSAVFNHVLKTLPHRPISLVADANKCHMYESIGFRITGPSLYRIQAGIWTAQGKVIDGTTSGTTSCHQADNYHAMYGTDLDEDLLQKVLEYDDGLHGNRTDGLMKAHLSMPEHLIIVAEQEGNVCGYGVFFEDLPEKKPDNTRYEEAVVEVRGLYGVSKAVIELILVAYRDARGRGTDDGSVRLSLLCPEQHLDALAEVLQRLGPVGGGGERKEFVLESIVMRRPSESGKGECSEGSDDSIRWEQIYTVASSEWSVT